MKSILLVLGTERYRDALLDAVAAIRAGERRAGGPWPASIDVAQPPRA
ncbi:MAG TPA: hypothetical protein VFR37_06725 [Longimicrobium sp.]|nr:hypothetical protein [Longimicrobium sp.]